MVMHVLQRNVYKDSPLKPSSSATINITDAVTAAAADCYEDRDGNTSTPHEFTVTNGFFRVYVPAGRYNINVSDGLVEKDYLDIEVGEWASD